MRPVSKSSRSRHTSTSLQARRIVLHFELLLSSNEIASVDVSLSVSRDLSFPSSQIDFCGKCHRHRTGYVRANSCDVLQYSEPFLELGQVLIQLRIWKKGKGAEPSMSGWRALIINELFIGRLKSVETGKYFSFYLNIEWKLGMDTILHCGGAWDIAKCVSSWWFIDEETSNPYSAHSKDVSNEISLSHQCECAENG